MATRKQRRRRQKERRHEYEYVYVDPEGQEVEVDEAEITPKKDRPAKAEARTPAAKKPAAGAVRTVQPPSWERVAKRTLLFAPFIIIFLYLVKPKDTSTAAALWPAAIMIVVLVPFMYAVDSFAYKTYQKRTAKRSSPKSK